MAKSKAPKIRLDKLLMDRGLCQSRNQAQGLIMSGEVLVEGQMVDKPGYACPEDAEVQVKSQPKYVSRGGLKLEGALAQFGVSVENRACLDIGASTGGFTDCLLKHGARFVHAVDVGYGQLDWSLREDPWVNVLERTHVKDLPNIELVPPPSLAVFDVSFISLKKVMGTVAALLHSEEGYGEVEMVTLVKPQFEYLDYCQPKGFDGIVQQSEDHRTILMGLIGDLTQLLAGWSLVGIGISPISGGKGNREFFFHWRQGGEPGLAPETWAAAVDGVLN